MADFIVLTLLGVIIGIIVYYLIKQRRARPKDDYCVGCAEHKSACRQCDVESLTKALKEELHNNK